MIKFLAHHSKHSKVAVIRLGDLFKTYHIVGTVGDGFGYYKEIDDSCARYDGPADDSHRNTLELHQFILTYETDKGWVGVPLYGKNPKEVLLQSVPDLQVFDIVNTRYDGINFWYQSTGDASFVRDSMRVIFSRKFGDNLTIRKISRLDGMCESKMSAIYSALSGRHLFEMYNQSKTVNELPPGDCACENLRVLAGKLPVNSPIHEMTMGFVNASSSRRYAN